MNAILRRLIPRAFKASSRIPQQILVRTQGRVIRGPFRDLKYIAQSVGSAYYPKLLGTYEMELHKILDEIISFNPDIVIDIGAAEGYYAVGMAQRLPQAQVVAFESTESGCRLLGELAALNHLSLNVSVRGTCTVESLRESLMGSVRPLVICDAEGAEEQLIDPAVVPQLQDAYILVELHDFIVKGVGAILVKRLSATHACEEIIQEKRRRTDYPFEDWYTKLLSDSYVLRMLDEQRPEVMSWLWCKPRSMHKLSDRTF